MEKTTQPETNDVAQKEIEKILDTIPKGIKGYKSLIEGGYGFYSKGEILSNIDAYKNTFLDDKALLEALEKGIRFFYKYLDTDGSMNSLCLCAVKNAEGLSGDADKRAAEVIIDLKEELEKEKNIPEEEAGNTGNRVEKAIN
jgi:hypothetical protein